MPLRHRQRAHVAFFVFPGFSDTIPTLSVVSTLVRRGYRVSYVTSDLFASQISALGAEVIRCPLFRNPFESSSREEVSSRNVFLSLTEETLSVTTPFYESNRPDLIIHDYVCFTGRILANKWGIPTVQVSSNFMMDRERPSRQAPEFFQEMLGYSGELMDFLGRYGVSGDVYFFHRERLNICFYPRTFQLDEYAPEEECVYAPRCAPERPYTPISRPKDACDRPVALVSTSTIYVRGPEYFKMCIDAFAGLHWHVILQIGASNDPAYFDPLPPHFEIIRRGAQIAILPYVDLLICAGGNMTTMEAMYCGVPLLMMTHGFRELETYADNSARLGVGKHLRSTNTNVAAIKESVVGMSEDTALVDRVKEMQRLVRAGPGSEEVANRIGDYIKSVT